MSPILVAILAALAGAIAVAVVLKRRPIQDEPKGDSPAAAAQAATAIKAEIDKERAELRKESEKERAHITELETRLHEREAALDKRAESLDSEHQSFDKEKKSLEALKEELRGIRKKQEESLERIAKLKKDEAKKILLELVEKESKQELLEKLRRIEAESEEAVLTRARAMLATVIGRISQEHTAEHTVATVSIGSEEMKGRIIGKEGRNIQAFEKATGVDLIIDETPDAVVISSFDPVRREVARMSLEKLIQDGRIQPSRIEEVVSKTQDEVNRSVKKAGEDAMSEAKVRGLPPEVIRILGSLKLRTSYGQNQLKHAVEVATIAGLLSAELGADEAAVRTAGLLHDLGKAVTHEVSGPHHHISMEIAKKYGLDEKIIHAIGAHHDDIEPQTLEAVIVRVADQISGARPGARRESIEQYIKRMQELENVAKSFEGVKQSYAIQAGREIRVVVEPTTIDDLEAMKLSKAIAKKIEGDLQYPGQIKVTVLRETRAIEYAR